MSIRAKSADYAANNDCWIQSCVTKDRGNHRSRRRLSVRPGDRDRVRLEPHQLCEHLCSRNYWNRTALCFYNPTATAYCLLLTAYCLLLTAYCLLLTAYCLLLTAYCFCLLPSASSVPLAPRSDPLSLLLRLRVRVCGWPVPLRLPFPDGQR